MSAPACPFGASWDELRLKDIRAFLWSSPPERSSWEAKGQDTKAKLAGFIRQECCGFANRRGGYLLLGAEDLKDAGWQLSGIEVPKVKELHDWTASLLRKLDPPPPFDVHEWGLSSGRRVVVVQVEAAPIPPVSVDGTVFIRHGSQTLRADGAAIRRLSEAGGRAERKAEKKVRKKTVELAEQLFVTFALGVGRIGDREQVLADSRPADVARARLREALAERWPKRTLEELAWRPEVTHDYLDDVALGPQRDLGYSGWRVAWKMEDAAQSARSAAATKASIERARQARKAGRRPRAGRSRLVPPGDQDVWMYHLDPEAVGVTSHFQLPIAGSFNTAFGQVALSRAELLLKAMLRTELELGADPDEPLLIMLALRNPWGQPPTVLLERWERMTVSPRSWREAASAEAAKKMLLEPPSK